LKQSGNGRGINLYALAVGVMGQGQSGGQTGGPNNYDPTNNPGVNSQMSQQGYDSSLQGRTNAEENGTKFSDETETAAIPKKAKKIKTLRSTKRHSERVRENERTETNESGD
jgi:hypothetical protein